mmetsp:Transcript_126/g.175  ORF Transcript_126/g.175 Transcript_126/m.175 type:complete len:209 (+) Transcript_126:86-712(+)|eukprot:CAMPEP_0202458012 /NCGR_PEP_ID=MMETSP1360-20130828/19618_1 /ASSEMBLY_ACC=CAM_ASM_000848 /TAXON_ID=515479 /ORGANISM="Licmophora paradoxa, Strain CCMP2313" /LENGTH=208 /DNA_ID=CAMNT_0049078319 /DNA_START=86 /DNA_END=712 /DNA_ORIENTATION=+
MQYFLLALTAGAASAFTGTPLRAGVISKSSLRMGVEDMVGKSQEFGNRVFDPLGFSNYASDETLAWFRHAELKHSRVAMLAATGWMVQKNGLGIIPYPMGESYLSGTAAGETHTLSADPFEAAMQLPAGGWWQLFFTAGVIELWTEAKKPHYMPSANMTPLDTFDGVGFKADEKMQLKELKNGRLAMIACMAYLASTINPAFVPLPMP